MQTLTLAGPPEHVKLQGVKGPSHTILFPVRLPDGRVVKKVTTAVAAMVGITPHNFRQRVKRLEEGRLREQDLFAPPVRRGKGLPVTRLSGDLANATGANQRVTAPQNEGNAAWQALGTRPRTHNLKKIVFGDLERKYLEG